MKAIISPRITLTGRTRLETVIPLSTPYLMFIDPSDMCNAKCSWCPSGNIKLLKSVGRKPQLMNFELYKKIIDDLCNMPEWIKTLRLYADGEPLLNPFFPDMVRYAKNTGIFGQIDTITNAKLLYPHLSSAIIEAGLDKIFISVPQDYDEKYILNIIYLYRISKRKCHIHVKIIGDGMNNTTKEKFMQDFGDISDSIFIEHLSPCWPEYKVNGVDEIGIYGQPIKEVQICPYLFYSVKINSNGTVSMCFLDWKHQSIIGDIKKESFKNIWNGTRLKALRKAHLRFERHALPMCYDCKQLKYGMPDDIDQYAKEILEKLK